MSSTTTHPSLLSRLRDPADQSAWREFDGRYGDMILRYACRRGLQYSDAEDVRQLVMLSLSKALPGFHYSPDRGLFRNYLGQVVRRAIIQFHRSARPNGLVVSLSNVGSILDPQQTETHDPVWNDEWVRHHLRTAMKHIRATFEPRSVEVFDHLLAGESVQQVAQEFAVSEQAVHKIKQRVRDRMRKLIAEQIRDESMVEHEGPE